MSIRKVVAIEMSLIKVKVAVASHTFVLKSESVSQNEKPLNDDFVCRRQIKIKDYATTLFHLFFHSSVQN